MADKMEKGISGKGIKVVESEDSLNAKPAWKQRFHKLGSILRRSVHRHDTSESPWPKLVRRTIYLLSVLTGLFAIAFMYVRFISFLESN